MIQEIDFACLRVFKRYKVNDGDNPETAIVRLVVASQDEVD